MVKKRNSLLELYRILFCFWVLYFHHFFFFKNTEKIYREAYLAVEFFFILAGVFLLNTLKKTDDLPFWKACGRVLWGRLKPLVCTLAVVFCFNVTGIIIDACKYGFDFERQIGTVYYLWFLPFLFFGVFVMFLLYRLIKNKCLYLLLLIILAIAGYCVEFGVEFGYDWADQLPLSIARSLGGFSLGILVSCIPRLQLQWKKINFHYFFLPIIIALIACLAYDPRSAWGRGGIILLYAALIYFTLGTNCSCKVFDFLGSLSMRMYIYMAILCMLILFGVTHHRILFFIDLGLALTDMFVFKYGSNMSRQKIQYGCSHFLLIYKPKFLRLTECRQVL